MKNEAYVVVDRIQKHKVSIDIVNQLSLDMDQQIRATKYGSLNYKARMK